MKAAFIMKALLAEEFESLFEANDEELARRNATWLNVDSNPGYPCRVTLSDAEVGERVLAIAFDHHDVASPYKSAGPILIRDNAVTRKLDVNEVPEMFHHRLLSIRGYDFDHMMIEAEVIKGVGLKLTIQDMFDNELVDYIHIHNADRGCFDCSVYRAELPHQT